jgi:hypothetical protein
MQGLRGDHGGLAALLPEAQLGTIGGIEPITVGLSGARCTR